MSTYCPIANQRNGKDPNLDLPPVPVINLRYVEPPVKPDSIPNLNLISQKDYN